MIDFNETTLPDNLHHEQRDAILGIIESHKEKDFAVLEGPAGTGKTFTMDAYRKRTWFSNLNTILTATTHQAATHLGKTAMTIHSALGLIVRETPEGTYLRPGGKVKILQGQTIVVDEASMVDMPLAKMIREIAVDDLGCKILFVGDPYQLPPVNGKCPVFSGKIPIFRLDKIHRQGEGNPIINLATSYRYCIDGQVEEPTWETKLNSDGHGVLCVDDREFMRLQDEHYLADQDETLTVAWRNKAVIAHNARIRPVVLGEELARRRLVEGELLKVNHAVTRNNEILIGNNTRLHAGQVAPHTDEHGFTGFMVKTIYGELFSPDNIIAAKKFVEVERKKAAANYRSGDKNAGTKWRQYCELRDSYVDLRPAYASTVHKAQGSTFKTVFIDLVDIMDNGSDERLNMLYTALTRASEKVIVLVR